MGPVDGTFVAYVEEHDPELKFSTHEVLYDLGTNRAIDFIHMAAVLNSYVRYGDTISLVVSNISTDYAGTICQSITNSCLYKHSIFNLAYICCLFKSGDISVELIKGTG